MQIYGQRWSTGTAQRLRKPDQRSSPHGGGNCRPYLGSPSRSSKSKSKPGEELIAQVLWPNLALIGCKSSLPLSVSQKPPWKLHFPKGLESLFLLAIYIPRVVSGLPQVHGELDWLVKIKTSALCRRRKRAATLSLPLRRGLWEM